MSRQSELQYFHSVARVGVQIADALEYAHNQGILHRDIKPSNLLLDLRGTVWLTDFGLAKAEDSGELTSAGDIVGTLRFMAPERLEGRSEPRSDIYALGVTLYEMLTLRPAFQDSQRGRLIDRIRQEEPTRPRALDVRIPADLETVILKASAKNPTDRYATAQELADDLKRFLLDEPIRAKRPTLLQRARKWSRRHQAVVVTAAIGSLAAVIVLVASVGWVLWDKATRRAATMQEAGAALDEAKRHQLQARWPEALAAARRAEGSLATGESNLEIRADVEALRADLEMVILLDDIRNRKSEIQSDQTFDFEQADSTYERAFREFGIDVETLTAEEAAARIRERSVAAELTAALDDWASVRRLNSDREEERWRSLFAVARLADTDELRNQLRRALEVRDRDALVQMAERDQVAALPPATIYLLAKALYDHRETKHAITLLGKAQHLRPAEFWINYLLAYFHANNQPPSWEDAVRFYTAAVTSRPQSVGVHLNLSWALHQKGAFQEAIDFARTAIRLKPDYAEAYIGLGQAQRSSGALDEAIAAFREATRLQPENAVAFLQMGHTYAEKGELARAIEAYQKAIQLKPDYVLAHHGVGLALRRNGQAAEAIAAYRQAIRLEPGYEPPYESLAWLLVTCGDPQLREPAEAAELAKRSIARQPNPANARTAWNILALANYRLGDGKTAIAAVEKAMELGEGGAGFEWIILALSHAQLGNEEEGRTWYHRAVKSLSEYPPDDTMRRLSTEAAKLLNLPD